ncbi:hypothetical protein [Pseudoxanthomonas sp.]|uniref:hypothetical protein n=1 Tax=Pseudoxanthomonas sp. TaxID=1871049 RepID=UPI002590A176|nr:hypothetical protein [Pseudoxanthomonas sp.]MCR6687074.1 hypothetical protein [Pseudoxanthomonas sp.]
MLNRQPYPRNALTERLLARECTIAFVSLAEAIKVHGHADSSVDLPCLEAALQAPMLAFLDEGLADPGQLAMRLASAVAEAKAFPYDNLRTGQRCRELLLRKNGIHIEPGRFDLIASPPAPASPNR